MERSKPGALSNVEGRPAGDTGGRRWGFQLGPRTIGSPSIDDLDGDGLLEIVAPNFDGQVWALGGP